MSNLNIISIPEEKVIDGEVFPLSVSPNVSIKTMSDTLAFLTQNRDEILAKLLQHGSILFRGFPVADAKDFNDFVLAFGWQELPYIGGAAVRNNVCGVVFTSNESPPDQPIPFHHGK